tara:strand:- start:47 stop:415 length:369 start_codon:yes stop_codon:yes gene_type:complete
MRKFVFLLTFMMLASSLAGCAGDDDEPSPIGEWWSAETMAVDISEDGTLIDGDGNSGTWSTDGEILTMTINDPANFNFAVQGDWMWLKVVDDDDDCHAFSSESIPNDEYDDRVSELTPPSFC